MAKYLFELHGLLFRKYTISDENLRLNAVRESIQELSQWLSFFKAASLIEDNHLFIHNSFKNWEDATEFCFGIFQKGCNTLLGEIRINHINHRHKKANLTYWICTKESGKGYASKAVKSAAKIAFEALNFNRLEIYMSVRNKGSIRVAEKSGAIFEGTLRHRILLDSGPENAYLYSIIPEDFSNE